MLYIALVSTAVAWILIYFLERRILYQIEIRGIDAKVFPESVAAYRHALKQQKCYIIQEKKNVAKSKIAFIFSSPSKLRREGIEEFLAKRVPENNRGSLDWDT